MLYTCQVVIEIADNTNQEYKEEVLDIYNANILPAINLNIWGNGIARAVDVTKLIPVEGD